MKFIRILKNSFFFLIGRRTIGARILLIKDKQILLVKHSYQEGWYTIGGGVDRGESPLKAICRELKEEVGVTLTSPPTLFAVYYSHREKRDDYVIFYIGTDHQQEECYSNEIKEKRWFPLDKLPADITPATQRRIDEYLGKIPISDIW